MSTDSLASKNFDGEVTAADENIAESRKAILLTVMAVAGVFLAYSLIAVPVPGVNEPHYLTKARSFADPEWCGNDFFLNSADAHAVFFYLVGPLTTQISFEVVAVTGRTLSLLLLACGWTMLGRRLGLMAFGNIVSAAAFCLIAMTGNFSGEWIIGGFESKVPAYGFAFVGLAYWLDAWNRQTWQSYLRSGMMFGLAVALHPVVGAWFCVGLCISEVLAFSVFRHSEQTFGRLVTNGFASMAATLVFALPGLIPAVSLVLASDVEPTVANSANKIQVYWRLAHHLDPSTFPIYSWIHLLTLLCSAGFGLFLVKKFAKDAGESHPSVSTRSWSLVTTLLAASFVIAVTGVLIGWHSAPFPDIPDWEWRAKILRYYPFRFVDALLPCVCALLVGTLTACCALNPVNRRRILIGCVIAVIVFAATNRKTVPSGYPSRSYAQWKQACEWIRDNTASNSLILAPRESFGLKWFAERAEYVCVKDCPQDAAGITEWNERLWRLHRWSESSYQDQRFDNEDLVRLHSITDVTHILTRQLGPFESEPIYQNEWWRVYEVPKSLNPSQSMGFD